MAWSRPNNHYGKQQDQPWRIFNPCKSSASETSVTPRACSATTGSEPARWREFSFGNSFVNLSVFHLSGVHEVCFCEHPEILEWANLATGARKQSVEVPWRSLNEEDRKLFKAAKDQEVKAWIDHGTVGKVARGTLRDEQIMRCRWIVTWKPPAPGTSSKRAKAPLVVLGFEGPQLSSIAADAPTLTKDGKQLLLQQVASRGWRLVNFDISTAFLKGAGDGEDWVSTLLLSFKKQWA